MLLKLLLLIILLFISRLFIKKVKYNDYFFIILVFLIIMFSYIYVTTSFNTSIFIILILLIALILYSYFNFNTDDNRIIILDGKINFKNMIINNYSISDLANDLKIKKINNINNRYCGVLKSNKLDIYEKIDKSLPVTLVLNGELFENSLLILNKSREWLNNLIMSNNINISNILYAFYYKSSFYIIKK